MPTGPPKVDNCPRTKSQLEWFKEEPEITRNETRQKEQNMGTNLFGQKLVIALSESRWQHNIEVSKLLEKLKYHKITFLT